VVMLKCEQSHEGVGRYRSTGREAEIRQIILVSKLSEAKAVITETGAVVDVLAPHGLADGFAHTVPWKLGGTPFYKDRWADSLQEIGTFSSNGRYGLDTG